MLVRCWWLPCTRNHAWHCWYIHEWSFYSCVWDNSGSVRGFLWESLLFLTLSFHSTSIICTEDKISNKYILKSTWESINVSNQGAVLKKVHSHVDEECTLSCGKRFFVPLCPYRSKMWKHYCRWYKRSRCLLKTLYETPLDSLKKPFFMCSHWTPGKTVGL